MSDSRDMNIEAFEAAATRWGADVSRWPGDARAGAEALFAASSEARALHADLIAMEADFAFAQDAPPIASDDLMARVLADAAAVAESRSPEPAAAPAAKRGWRFLGSLDLVSPFWRAAGACAASALVGVFVGYMSPAPIAEAATSMASLELITGDDGVESGESFDLAMNDLEPF